MALDRAKFFSSVRGSLFGGRLSEAQVQGLDAMLDAAPAAFSLEHVAYCLATAFHETGAKMQPVTENLVYSSAGRIREVWPTRFPSEASAKAYVRKPQELANRVYGGRLGNVGADDGWNFRGRGYVQITGRENYARASRILGLDLLTKPELATDPKIAAMILYCGMTDGWFTGKKLGQYFRPGLADPFNARDIINADKNRKEDGVTIGSKIAGHYHKFAVALRVAGYAPAPSKPASEPDPIPVADAHPVPPPPDIEPVEPAKPGRAYAVLAAILEALFGRKSA